ncbi:helix-turn-helix domain-containing protein [Micromonospora sp. NPDC001898]|uniref:AraC-like ligand-binding domain-containing protein n=1 Tax=Micromonospora sp. NPDC001898 TaxID=3364221 RepID=UPI0036BBD4F2
MGTLRTETVDTAALPPAERWPFWVDMSARVSAPIAFASDHAADFRGRARLVDLGGGIQLTRFRYQSLIGRRTARLIRQADPEVYQIPLTVAGNSAISARRRDTAMGSGDFALIDWGRPHDIMHASRHHGREDAASATVVISRALLPLDADKVDRLSAVRISGTQGPGALLAQHLHRITRSPEQFRATDAPHLADVTLTLVSLLLARHLDAEAALPTEMRQQVLLTQVRDFVERHLGDPDLSPQSVADAHHVALRTLHRLFADQDESVSGVIRRRRLERCRRDLADPLLRDQTVQAIGARWGFRDKTHFSRAFRAAYGTSPRAFRESRWQETGRPDPLTAGAAPQE